MAQERAELEEMVDQVIIRPAMRRNNIPIYERVEIRWRPGVVHRPLVLPTRA